MKRVSTRGGKLSQIIIDAVADETGGDPKELEPLTLSTDVDALDSLSFRNPGEGPMALTILYEGCQVTIDRDSVVVEKVQWV